MPSSGVSEESYSVLLYINTKLKKKVKSTGLLLQKTQNWFQASTWWLPNIFRDLTPSPNFWGHQTPSGVHTCRLAKCSHLTIDQRKNFENGQKHNNNTNNNKSWKNIRIKVERGVIASGSSMKGDTCSRYPQQTPWHIFLHHTKKTIQTWPCVP